ncbi:hypothetical protein [Bifidobacterium avesanii]|uniref:CTP synthase n=1 Tax=Bifidobacterium avesanii TaxID=1798157 RepID=A0A7K3TIZ1_9BIFI|nr:hypothetical protein [Bifidobacterium avesanii]NEG79075.1 hypothetical protein [Bifidobacterium avesanii]
MKRNDKLERLIGDAERSGMCLMAGNDAERAIIRPRVQSGELLRVRCDLYARPQYWNALPYAERILHMLRALAAKHPRWIFCAISAAAVWGLNRTYTMHGQIHLAVTASTHSRDRRYLKFHYIPNPQTVVINGLRVTGLMQTAFDCARTLPFPEALAVCDAALREHHFTKGQLESFVQQQRGCAGAQRARFVVAHADGRSENGGESIVRAWIIIWGFAVPDLQQWFRSPMGGRAYRVDFLWRLDDGRIIVLELDGREKYENPAMNGSDSVGAVLAEKEREDDLQLLGNVTILRTSYRDVLMNPGKVQAKLALAGVPRHDPPRIPGSPYADPA